MSTFADELRTIADEVNNSAEKQIQDFMNSQRTLFNSTSLKMEMRKAAKKGLYTTELWSGVLTSFEDYGNERVIYKESLQLDRNTADRLISTLSDLTSGVKFDVAHVDIDGKKFLSSITANWNPKTKDNDISTFDEYRDEYSDTSYGGMFIACTNDSRYGESGYKRCTVTAPPSTTPN